VNVTRLNKDYAALVEGVVQRIGVMGLQIGMILADRELFNLAAILKLYELGADFIMAAKIDKRIKKLLERHKRENGRKSAIFTYKFRDERSPEFYLVAIPNPDYDLAKREGKGNRDFYLFATSIAFGSPEEFVKRVPKECRRRWKIETGYRVKKEFKIINDLFTVLRHSSALLRRSMHHAQLPERVETDSTRYRASTEVPYSRGYRETPKMGAISE
jgi:hypothetical protein